MSATVSLLDLTQNNAGDPAVLETAMVVLQHRAGGMLVGEREVLSDEAYAEVLADTHDLADEEAEALALHRAGWLEADLVQEFSPLGHHVVEADDVLKRALEKAGK